MPWMKRPADVFDDIERGSQRLGLYLLATGLTTTLDGRNA
jgi:hypothetical protein